MLAKLEQAFMYRVIPAFAELNSCRLGNQNYCDLPVILFCFFSYHGLLCSCLTDVAFLHWDGTDSLVLLVKGAKANWEQWWPLIWSIHKYFAFLAMCCIRHTVPLLLGFLHF